MTIPVCRCPSYDPKCTRTATDRPNHMAREMTLRDWEICSGKCPPERPCSPLQSEQYRALWDGLEIPIVLTKRIRLDCKFLGDETRETQPCTKCPGSPRIKLLKCALYGSCTVMTPIDGVVCCGDGLTGCKDYVKKT